MGLRRDLPHSAKKLRRTERQRADEKEASCKVCWSGVVSEVLTFRCYGRKGLDAGATVGKEGTEGGSRMKNNMVLSVEKETQDSKGWEDGTGVTSCSPEDRDVM